MSQPDTPEVTNGVRLVVEALCAPSDHESVAYCRTEAEALPILRAAVAALETRLRLQRDAIDAALGAGLAPSLEPRITTEAGERRKAVRRAVRASLARVADQAKTCGDLAGDEYTTASGLNTKVHARARAVGADAGIILQVSRTTPRGSVWRVPPRYRSRR